MDLSREVVQLRKQVIALRRGLVGLSVAVVVPLCLSLSSRATAPAQDTIHARSVTTTELYVDRIWCRFQGRNVAYFGPNAGNPQKVMWWAVTGNNGIVPLTSSKHWVAEHNAGVGGKADDPSAGTRYRK